MPVRKAVRWLENLVLRPYLKLEFDRQRYEAFNERPAEYRFVFKHLTRICPQTILDVGTGQGSFPSLLRECGFHVTAVDNIRDFWPSGMVNRHYYVRDDDIRRPRVTGSFDLITCISVLEHIRDSDAAVRSMFNLLKPGGHAVMTFPYHEEQYIENVYRLQGTNAPPALPYITQAFARRQLEAWIVGNCAELLDHEYWRYLRGRIGRSASA